MKAPEKLTKTEALVLALTLVLLACTGMVFALQQTQSGGADYVIRAEGAAQEALPSAGEEEREPSVPVPTAETPLNINTATETELCMLSGIGEVLAERIIAYREENGPFAQKADIMNVAGIGEKTYGEIQEVITVGEAET